MLLPDYHTHTARCGHATRPGPVEYVEAARAKGLCRHRHRRPPPAAARARLRALHGRVRPGRLCGRGGSAQVSLPRIRPAWGGGRLSAPDRLRGRLPPRRAIRSTTPSARSTTWEPGASTTRARCDHYADHDIDEVWAEYFDLVGDAAESGLFTILGHLDLVKKFGYRPTRILKVELDHLVDRIARAGVLVEINTAGLHRPVGEAYPTLDILRRLCDAGVGITFGSDAHQAGRGGPRLRPRGRLGSSRRLQRIRVPRGRRRADAHTYGRTPWRPRRPARAGSPARTRTQRAPQPGGLRRVPRT